MTRPEYALAARCYGNDGLVHFKHLWVGVWCNPLRWVRRDGGIGYPALTCLWCVSRVSNGL